MSRLISFFSFFQHTVQSLVVHDGYTAKPMVLGEAKILGINIGPTSVAVNGQIYTQYTYSNKVGADWLFQIAPKLSPRF